MMNLILSGAAIIFVATLFWAVLRCPNSKNIPIVIGVYNKEKEIEGTLRNMIKKYPDTRIITVDYGSTDETVKIIKLLQRDYPEIALIDRLHYNALLS